MTKILGISAFYHDSAAVLIDDGRIVAAAQEERFSRIKHDASFPAAAIKYCLQEGRCGINDLDSIVFYEAPDLKRQRQIQGFLDTAPFGLAGFRKFGGKVFFGKTDSLIEIERKIMEHWPKARMPGPIVAGEHHISHAASAFYPAPFDEATILTIDGVGEWDTTTICHGRGNEIRKLASISFPHSLGLLYSAFTAFCGFKVNDGEYKLMGLAPYGEPRFADRIRSQLIDVRTDGSFRLDLSYFDFLSGARMFGRKFKALLDGPCRLTNDPVTQRHMDIAASIQAVLEDIVLRLVEHAVSLTGVRRLCMAGGVALNCVANGKILRSGLVDDLWVQPAEGDAGGALGCALHHYYQTHDRGRVVIHPDAMSGSRLGPSFSHEEIEATLNRLGATFTVVSEGEVTTIAANLLADGKILGWFDGRMEFGPRALGGRSIIADPRPATMQRVLNQKIKFRESFRPFAPIVLAEEAGKWFGLGHESPYMLIVAPILEAHRRALSADEHSRQGFERLDVVRSSIPAVTHVDYSARVQTVDAHRNPKLHRLLATFARRTGIPILVNTSFNVNDEPIVCTPEDAYRCLVNTEIDWLFLGRCILKRVNQSEAAVAAASIFAASVAVAKAPSDSLYTLY